MKEFFSVKQILGDCFEPNCNYDSTDVFTVQK